MLCFIISDTIPWTNIPSKRRHARDRFHEQSLWLFRTIPLTRLRSAILLDQWIDVIGFFCRSLFLFYNPYFSRPWTTFLIYSGKFELWLIGTFAVFDRVISLLYLLYQVLYVMTFKAIIGLWYTYMRRTLRRFFSPFFSFLSPFITFICHNDYLFEWI